MYTKGVFGMTGMVVVKILEKENLNFDKHHPNTHQPFLQQIFWQIFLSDYPLKFNFNFGQLIIKKINRTSSKVLSNIPSRELDAKIL